MDIDDILGTLGDLDDDFSGAGAVNLPSTDDFLKLVMCIKALAQIVQDEL